MKLAARLQEVRGSFSAANATQAWRERAGLRLIFTDDEGQQGEGEASPLPGYSPDSLSAAREALAGLDGLEVDPERPLDALPALEASAAFAAEVALLDWASRRSDQPFASLLPGPRHGSLPIAALVRSAPEGRERLAAGYRTLKLKVGRDLDAELELARTLRAAGATLRFDANGSLDRQGLAPVLATLAELGAELLEEPCAGPWPASPVPLAVDESLFADPAAALERVESGEAAWVVLKPMCLGGMRAVTSMAQRVQGAGGRVLLSHTFGGPIERAAVGAMALAFGDGPPGLAPHAGLEVWPAAHTEAFAGPTLCPSDAPGLGLEWGSAW